MSAPGPADLFKPDRLLTFSDGVFGVAITLLVVDVRLPPIAPDGGDPAFLQALWGMRQKLFVFAFTFVVVGMSWLGHHRKFAYIDRVDGRLLWMNLLTCWRSASCPSPAARSPSTAAAASPSRCTPA